MYDKTKAIIGIVAFALMLGVAALAYQTLRGRVTPPSSLMAQSEPSGETETQGSLTLAPDFSVQDSEGEAVKLSSFLGKPVVLNFWASWCPPCKSEMPEFDEVYSEWGDDVAFMMIDLVDGQQETKEKGEAYIAAQGFSFPVYYDTGQEAAYAYGIASIPTTLFINADGYIVTGAQGAIDAETLRKGIGYIIG